MTSFKKTLLNGPLIIISNNISTDVYRYSNHIEIRDEYPPTYSAW